MGFRLLVCAAVGGLALALGACGGDDGVAPPPVPTSEDTRTVAFEPPPDAGQSTVADVDAPPFPATSPADVVALATQRPDATAVYDVQTTTGGYAVELAQRAGKARVRVVRDGRETAVGLDLAAGTITFTCTGDEGGDPDCAQGDADGEGAKALQDVAGILGSEAIGQSFGALATLGPDVVGVGQDEQAGTTVSCLAGSLDGRDLRLCATAEGVVTQLTDGATTALVTAFAVSTAADVARPTAGDALGGEGPPLGSTAEEPPVEDPSTVDGETAAEDAATA